MNKDFKLKISRPPVYLVLMMYLSTLCLPAFAIPVIAEIFFNLVCCTGLHDGSGLANRYVFWPWGWFLMLILLSLSAFTKFFGPAMKYGNSLIRSIQLPFVFIAYVLGVLLLYAGPAGFVLYSIKKIISGPDQAMYIYILACISAGVSGFYASVSIFRRSVWLLSVKNTIFNLPTSKARSAAVGLVELKGKARPQSGRGEGSPILYGNNFDGRFTDIVEPFYIEDDSGRLLVQLPSDYRMLSREPRVILNKRYRKNGVQEEISLMPGDEILVIGYLDVAAIRPPEVSQADAHLVRPVEPPGGNLFSMFSKLPPTIWYGEPPYLFLVTDSNETDAKNKLFKNSYKLLGTSIIWSLSALWVFSIGLYGIFQLL